MRTRNSGRKTLLIRLRGIRLLSFTCRFEDSEYKLHEQIKRCSVFATETKIYPTLVELNFVDTIVYLLSHDNILIIIETTKLL